MDETMQKLERLMEQNYQLAGSVDAVSRKIETVSSKIDSIVQEIADLTEWIQAIEDNMH